MTGISTFCAQPIIETTRMNVPDPKNSRISSRESESTASQPEHILPGGPWRAKIEFLLAETPSDEHDVEEISYRALEALKIASENLGSDEFEYAKIRWKIAIHLYDNQSFDKALSIIQQTISDSEKRWSSALPDQIVPELQIRFSLHELLGSIYLKKREPLAAFDAWNFVLTDFGKIVEGVCEIKASNQLERDEVLAVLISHLEDIQRLIMHEHIPEVQAEKQRLTTLLVSQCEYILKKVIPNYDISWKTAHTLSADLLSLDVLCPALVVFAYACSQEEWKLQQLNLEARWNLYRSRIQDDRFEEQYKCIQSGTELLSYYIQNSKDLNASVLAETLLENIDRMDRTSVARIFRMSQIVIANLEFEDAVAFAENLHALAPAYLDIDTRLVFHAQLAELYILNDAFELANACIAEAQNYLSNEREPKISREAIAAFYRAMLWSVTEGAPYQSEELGSDHILQILGAIIKYTRFEEKDFEMRSFFRAEALACRAAGCICNNEIPQALSYYKAAWNALCESDIKDAGTTYFLAHTCARNLFTLEIYDADLSFRKNLLGLRFVAHSLSLPIVKSGLVSSKLVVQSAKAAMKAAKRLLKDDCATDADKAVIRRAVLKMSTSAVASIRGKGKRTIEDLHAARRFQRSKAEMLERLYPTDNARIKNARRTLRVIENLIEGRER